MNQSSTKFSIHQDQRRTRSERRKLILSRHYGQTLSSSLPSEPIRRIRTDGRKPASWDDVDGDISGTAERCVS